MRLLVTGGGGQIGRAVSAAARARGFDVTAPARAALDIVDAAAVARAFDATRPEAVVNCAALTAVDRAEGERELAFAVNAEAAGRLARLCASRGVKLVHLSTDYVFDGAEPGPYREDDPPSPLNVYGASKLAGELAVAAAGAAHVVVRTSWVFAAEGRNFLRTMLRLGRTRGEVAVVDDQVGCPTAASDVATATLVALRGLAGGGSVPALVHYCGAEAMSWHGFARAIFAAASPLGFPCPTLRAIATRDFPTPARRPANSVLDCSLGVAAFGFVRRNLAASLAENLPAALAADQREG